MLKSTLNKLKWHEKPNFHSDQGWQYQHKWFQQLLKNRSLKQSMFRKGNYLDNVVAENFLGILKTKMYHGETFSDANELLQKHQSAY